MILVYQVLNSLLIMLIIIIIIINLHAGKKYKALQPGTPNQLKVTNTQVN